MFSLWSLDWRASLCEALLNSSELQDKLGILVQIDCGNCFIIDGGGLN